MGDGPCPRVVPILRGQSQHEIVTHVEIDVSRVVVTQQANLGEVQGHVVEDIGCGECELQIDQFERIRCFNCQGYCYVRKFTLA